MRPISSDIAQRPRRRQALLLAAVIALTSFVAAHAQDTAGSITPNYKDTDIRQIIEAVGAVTGKSFVIDPRVKADVTMLSNRPMTPDAFYETFLSILEVHGYVAVDTGDVVKILPDANVRQLAADRGGARGDVITRVVQVNNVGAAQLVPILRPLIPQYGHLAAHAPSNMLIISDRAANVDRMLSIIRRIDQASDEEIEVVPLQHASAAEIVRIMQTLAGAQRADGTPSTTSLVADERTNSVLIGGEKSTRLRLRALIAHLDTPLEDGGNMQVRYLRYANAPELAEKLQSQFAVGAEGQPANGNPANSAFSIWADEQTNALIITAPPKTMRSIMSVVDKIDIRRAQVLVEAIIVEVRADSNLDLGISWAAFDDSGNTPFAATDFPSGSRRTLSSVAAAAGADNDAAALAGAIGPGVTFGLGRIQDGGTSFAAILSALQGDSDTNIISTPTIVTMDNEEARIEVGQEVPFVTGSFSNAGGNNGNLNPFQTINRERVGTLLEITPQINEGDAILLSIKQETSSISDSVVSGAADLVTNERVIETSVIVDDGGILVLGGLIDDTLRESESRVPILGSIPLLGALFRARNTSKLKVNQMIFIRPKILRDGTQTFIETNSKYNYIRDLQLNGSDTAGRPILPPVESYQRIPSGEPAPIDLRSDDDEASQ